MTGKLYDSEYENYEPSSLASDCDLYDDDGHLMDAINHQLIGGEQDKIRRVSQHITRSFGQPRHAAGSSSDSEDI